MPDQYIIRPLTADDLPHVATLEARIYGPGRFARTAYRLREGNAQHTELCMSAWRGDTIAGAVRFTHITLGEACDAALLGPLTVATEHTGHNLGVRLIEAAANVARSINISALILVGDAPYYAKAGFTPVPNGQITMPGPVDPTRLLILELTPGVTKNCHGTIKARPQAN